MMRRVGRGEISLTVILVRRCGIRRHERCFIVILVISFRVFVVSEYIVLVVCRVGGYERRVIVIVIVSI
jgi:hypothetical protein